MKLVSWNVAGFRACLNKGFENFFKNIDADIFCLQEVKATKEQIPFVPNGYYEYINIAEKKGYSGTMIYTKIKPLNVSYGMNILEHDNEGRIITLEFENFYLINVYVPNVKRSLERLPYRMKWEDDFLKYVKNLEKTKPVIICGDFNVAHNEIDIKNAKQNIGNAGFTYEEREKFTSLLNSGFIDTFRYFNKDKKDSYTWWSYMKGVRERNIGWRIDYFLVSSSFISNVTNAEIYSNILGSDHCPIGLEIKK
ncbi:MAG: exodeoxyribonuclease III [Bacilli bacterium]|nr:exodeoxyribonuclease III [Bacilli bacterium]